MQLASIFTNSMVLQRDMPIKIFGTGRGRVQITFLDETVTALSEDDFWCVTLQPHSAGGPYTMQVLLDDTCVTLADVLIGDVFLACGQSNMEMPLFKTEHGLEEAEHCQNNNIRFFTVPRRFKTGVDNYGWHFSSIYNTDTPWKACDKQSALFFTAIGYYFAKNLERELNIPIGIISCNWGGKKIESFIQRKYFYDNSALKPTILAYDRLMDEINMPEYEKCFTKYLADMKHYCVEKRPDELECVQKNGLAWTEAQEPSFGLQPIMEPGPYDGVSAGNLWETMFSTIVPYGVKAMLWYQGEGNTRDPVGYAEKYLTFLHCIRDHFGENVPSYAVELTPYMRDAASFLTTQTGYEMANDNWAFLREQQQIATEMEKNNYLVTTQGLVSDMYAIHPREKKLVADRLSLKVLRYSYGRDVMADQPLYRSVRFAGNKAFIDFWNVKTFTGYTHNVIMYIAGADKVMHRAVVEIMNGNQLCVYSDQVDRPILVRYAFEMFYFGSHLYNEAGLPLAPFRTDR